MQESVYTLININQILEKCINIIHFHKGSRNITIKKEFQIVPFLRGNNTRLQQAFLNIIIAATNMNLEEAVRRKEFREDLYYRLNVIVIECLPLRFRKQDIKTLALNFINKFSRKFNKNINEISPDIWRILKNYDWPGNIRELENAMESAVALTTGTTLCVKDLPLRIRVNPPNQSNLNHGILENQEIEAIKIALEKFGGHREKVARELGISRRTLQYKLNKFDLRSK